MSGHSKWSKIKHKKAIEDAKKGKVFSKLSQQITHAARQGGGDPALNPSLRLYLQEAKEVGFSSDSVQKAIDKGTGEGGGAALQEVSYEGYGPGGASLIIDVLTDNSNRVVADIRKILDDGNGRLADPGSVSWNFEVKGMIAVKPGKMVPGEKYGDEERFVEEDKDEVEMNLMDIEGVMDIEEDGDKILVMTDLHDLTKVRDSILKLEYVVVKAEPVKVPNNQKTLSEADLEKFEALVERVEEYEDVQNVWTDVN